VSAAVSSVSGTDRRRLIAGLLFAAGAAAVTGPPSCRETLFAAAAVVVVACAPGVPRARTAAAAAVALAAGAAAGLFQARSDSLPDLLRRFERQGFDRAGGIVEFEGRLADAAALADGRRELFVRLAAARPAGGCRAPLGRLPSVRIRLVEPPRAGGDRRPGARPGDWIRGTARLQTPRPSRNPGGFDYASYLKARGVALAGGVKSARLLRAGPDRLSAAAGAAPAARAAILERLRDACGPRAGRIAAFLAALLLGERQAVDRDLERTLQRAGVYHIVALSGLNVGLVALLAAGAARLAGAGPGAGRAAAALAVAAYWLLARGGGSIARASLMALLVAGGGCLGRRVRPIGAVVVSAVLILAHRSVWALDAGFQLSYAATLGILIAGLPGTRSRALTPAGAVARAAGLTARVSAAAWGATALIGARHFHALAPAALPANLAAVPIASVLLGLAILLATLGPEGGAASRAVALIAEGLVGLLERLSAWCSAPEFLSYRVVPPSSGTVLIGTAALLVAARGGAGRRAAAAILAGLLLLITAGGRGAIRPGPLEVVALDVGQGDALMVRLPGGARLLIDAGPLGRSGFDAGERVVAPALRALGILRLDLLAITHAHRDHLGGARAILEELRPAAVWLGRMPADDPAVKALEEDAARRGIPVLRPRRGVRLAWAGARLEVLHPAAAPGGAGRNDDSLVLRVVHGERAALLTGDIEGAAESALLLSGAPLRADLLKVAHHGSRTSSGAAFLAAVGPRLAVISVGPSNAWGHPDPGVLGRLREAGIAVLRTDRDGALRFRTDGSGPWRVERLTAGPWSGSEDGGRVDDETEGQHQKGQGGDQAAAGAGRGTIVKDGRVRRADDPEHDAEHDQVPAAEHQTAGDQEDDAGARHDRVGAARQRVEDVAAVKLSHRQEIEPGGQEPDPGRHEGRMEPHHVPGLQAGEGQRIEQLEQQAGGEADLARARRQPRDGRVRETVGQDRQGDDEPGDRSGDADVEQGAARGDGGADPDHGAEGAQKRRAGDEIGQGGADPVAPAGDVVPHLVRAEDQDDRDGVRNAEIPVPGIEGDVQHRPPRVIVQGQKRAGDEGGDDGDGEEQQVEPGEARAGRGRRGGEQGRRAPVAHSARRRGPARPAYLRLRRFFPGLKRIVLPGGMRTSVPVRGLRPIPFLRGLTWKTPKPRSSMRSP
jgi:competence protein ComEC